MSLAAWEQALTAMEDELDAHEAAVRTGNLTVVPEFNAPDGLGALPSSLAPRARQLSERIALLATFVQYQLVATDADLRFEKQPKHPGAQALYLDRAV